MTRETVRKLDDLGPSRRGHVLVHGRWERYDTVSIVDRRTGKTVAFAVNQSAEEARRNIDEFEGDWLSPSVDI